MVRGVCKIENIMKSSNSKFQISNKCQNSKNKEFDLEERTAVFGEDIIVFVKSLPKKDVNSSLIKQVVRSATSIGANYMEADGADSKKDFQYKISLCKKEAKETKHWVRMVAKANPDRTESCRKLWQEAQELTLIFSSILLSSKKIKRRTGKVQNEKIQGFRNLDFGFHF